ncbi:MAG: tRNA pseudouridine(38-40) synthase TruA [Pirellulales bacterium]
MRTLTLTLAYDGTDFAGWQVQPGQRTVQGELEAALRRIGGGEGHALAAGRTDAGVHALEQVVRLRTDSHLPAEVLQRAVNAELPADVAVLDASEANEHFHPIRDAVGKRYRYVIHDGPVREVLRRRYCWDYRHGRLNVAAMQRAAEPLRGQADFASFQSAGAERASTVRDVRELTIDRLAAPGQGRAGEGVSADSLRPEDWVIMEIEADGFLYNMVRAMVGTLVEVGRGAQTEAWPGEVLAAANRRRAGPTAPPQGLFLVRVDI